MAYTTINKSSLHRNTTLITGNNSTNAITGLGFAPDMVWTKKRNGAANHLLYDKVRGVGLYLYPNLTNAEGGNGTNSALQAFGSDGFTLNNGDDANGSGATGVAWSWKAGTTGSGTTAGSGTGKAYSYSANTTAGFSVTTYKGNGTAGHQIPHSLGVAPSMFIVKNRDGSNSWYVYHKDASYSGSNPYSTELYMDTTDRAYSTGSWNNVAPTSTSFQTSGGGTVNGNDVDYMCYAFAEKTGYSRFGKYTGNGDGSNGTFIYTGFAPRWLMVKRTDSAGNSWRIYSTNTDLSYGVNGITKLIHANLNNAEDAAGDAIDLNSNGFRHVTSSTDQNASGAIYIYAAFGQSIVGTNNIPCTAR